MIFVQLRYLVLVNYTSAPAADGARVSTCNSDVVCIYGYGRSGGTTPNRTAEFEEQDGCFEGSRSDQTPRERVKAVR